MIPARAETTADAVQECRDVTPVPTRGSRWRAGLPDAVRQFLHTESAGAALLTLATIVALVWANSGWSDSYVSLWHTDASVRIGDASLAMSLQHWVNDGLMVVYFFVIGLEVRREVSVGELRRPRTMLVPLVAGVVGMLVPALVYLAVSGDRAPGAWGVVIGTDTAFLLGALAVVGPAVNNQLRLFLLTLTVIDDIVAVSVIGIAYSHGVDARALLLAALGLAAVALLGRLRTRGSGVYVALIALVWLATVQSGVHAAITGMLAGLLVPAFTPDRAEVESTAGLVRAFRQSPMPEVGRTAQRGLARIISVNERLQVSLHPWTAYLVVPVFALANAGVDLRGGVLTDALTSRVTWGVVAGLVLGKTIGITLGALGAVKGGLGRLPQGVGWGHVAGGAALSGIGFTVALLIIDLGITDEVIADEARVGVLLAAVLAPLLGWLAFFLAARLRGERDADLPRVLSEPVDPAVDHIRGPVDAPLTVVEYADFECPFCARATGLGPALRQRFGDELRYVMRHLPLTHVHPHAERAALAAEAAAVQGRFWEMHDLLFEHYDELELEDLLGYAARIGLDVERFARDLGDDARLAARVRRDVDSAQASGARGTPTFFVAGRRHIGPHDAETLAAALEASRSS
ncbi:MAG: Na+/H+ antiporter NhaA [Kineosporiaceae bacterium]